MTSTTASPPRHRNAVRIGRMRAALEGAAGAGLSSMSLDELGDYVTDLHGLVALTEVRLEGPGHHEDSDDPPLTSGANR